MHPHARYDGASHRLTRPKAPVIAYGYVPGVNMKALESHAMGGAMGNSCNLAWTAEQLPQDRIAI